MADQDNERYSLTRAQYRQSLVAAYLVGWGGHVIGEKEPRAELYADTVLDAITPHPAHDDAVTEAAVLAAQDFCERYRATTYPSPFQDPDLQSTYLKPLPKLRAAWETAYRNEVRRQFGVKPLDAGESEVRE